MEFISFPTVGAIARDVIVKALPESTIAEASELMNANNVNNVVIEQPDGPYAYTIEDLLRFLHAGGSKGTRLSEVSLHKLERVHDHEHVLVALELLEENKFRYLAVLDEHNAVVGVVTYTDILASIDPAILIEKKTIGELLTRVEPATFSPDWILEDVLFHLQKLEDSIVVVEGGFPVGIITTRDVFKAMARGESTAQPLSRFMTAPVITILHSASIQETLTQLRTANIKRAVVVDDQGKLVGLVNQNELVGFAYGSWVNLIKHHAAELRELVVILEARTKTLEQSAYTDPLTGIGNRRFFHKRIEEEIERINRYHTGAFSIVLIDLDFFKKINDTHGHLVGDEVLKTVASELASMTRKTDEAVRWGGEEFALLLPHTPLHEAEGFATRVLTSVAAKAYPNNIRVTISAGVGEYEVGENENSFLERVDRVLYRAKINGRNRVEIDRK